MPPRVAATFGLADFVAAEDTRVTLRLLNHLGLKKPMVSYYEHALHHGEAILNRIEAGENCALCSDAGMPCISDPGEQIVREAHERGIRVVPIPAASACVTALAASGQPTARFVFEGFLPVPKRDRRERLAFLQNETRTMIFYEAPHKLRGTLDDLAAGQSDLCHLRLFEIRGHHRASQIHLDVFRQLNRDGRAAVGYAVGRGAEFIIQRQEEAVAAVHRLDGFSGVAGILYDFGAEFHIRAQSGACRAGYHDSRQHGGRKQNRETPVPNRPARAVFLFP